MRGVFAKHASHEELISKLYKEKINSRKINDLIKIDKISAMIKQQKKVHGHQEYEVIFNISSHQGKF